MSAQGAGQGRPGKRMMICGRGRRYAFAVRTGGVTLLVRVAWPPAAGATSAGRAQ